MNLRQYSEHELKAIVEIAREHGGVIKYANNFDIEREFFVRTGLRRASGALYMCHWRIQHGYYDHTIS